MITQVYKDNVIVDIDLFNVFIGYNTELIETTNLKDCFTTNYSATWYSFIHTLLREDLLEEKGIYKFEDSFEEGINRATKLLMNLYGCHGSYIIVPNVDNSLNPYLCRPLCELLVQIAKINNIQMILTANNPAFIDGIDLKDDTQRLFFVTRKGYIRRIENKDTHSDLKLSEMWLRGYL